MTVILDGFQFFSDWKILLFPIILKIATFSLKRVSVAIAASVFPDRDNYHILCAAAHNE